MGWINSYLPPVICRLQEARPGELAMKAPSQAQLFGLRVVY